MSFNQFKSLQTNLSSQKSKNHNLIITSKLNFIIYLFFVQQIISVSDISTKLYIFHCPKRREKLEAITIGKLEEKALSNYNEVTFSMNQP